MKKIPTLFEREFYNHEVISCVNKVTPGCEEALQEGVMTWKIDGACCAIMEGELYERYDAKRGKTPPEGAIPCCEADPVTGHHPHWVKCDRDNPADKWFFAAMDNTKGELKDGTYEATGLHFNSNPYGMDKDILVRHGIPIKETIPRNFTGIRKFLKEHPNNEGIVFWVNGEPVCKIKRSDFGFHWKNGRK